jgi:hypothetical protein
MGTRWGINRTVAQIHALLYLSPRPSNAEEIAEANLDPLQNGSYGGKGTESSGRKTTIFFKPLIL